MKTYSICYYPIKEDPPRRGSRYFGVVLLKPKRNELSKNQYDKLLAHPEYKKYVDQGVVQDLTEKPAPAKKSAPKQEKKVDGQRQDDITKMTISNALKLIKEETDPVQLQIWMTQELSNPRKNVLRTLEKATKAYPAQKEVIQGEQTSLFEV